jgi:P-type Mg2+ transporter
MSQDFASQIYEQLKSSREGLTSGEARSRLKTYGPNSFAPPRRGKGLFLFLSQFKSPLILLLLGAALLSYFLGSNTDAIIIFTIIFLSALLSFFQERGALNALEKLLQIVENKVRVLRDKKEIEIPFHFLVPGDVILLNAGDLIPADCILLETNYLFIDESMLTGESYPVEKTADIKTSAFLGTIVVSGYATAIVTITGRATEYGKIVEHIRLRPPETAFEVGIRRFGYFLIEVTMVLVLTIFVVNIYLHKPIIESLLFSLAIAVGLTPQLLPAIISVNLSHGARRMAKKHVVIKRLSSIENFGQMDVLCADKTGTLTLGQVHLERAVDLDGKESEKVAFYGFLNAHFQAGYSNPLDQAILKKLKFDASPWKKLAEIPYDFIRKRLSVLCTEKKEQILITKGAVPQVLSLCDRIELSTGKVVPLDQYRAGIEHYFEKQAEGGFRTLGVAYGEGKEEKNLIFLGFLQFSDPIKPDVNHVIADLKKKGVELKIITGDHSSVAHHVAASLGLPKTAIIVGSDLNKISDRALLKVAKEKNIFAEIEPNQKERLILALRKSGCVVGFLGDGINDVAALHSADVGIAVNSSADAAKEAADIVILKKDLSVLRDGIEEGRKTFINTLKYVYMATSANFGNMFSMAGASLFLAFLPLLPKQVLFVNFLSDLPEMALATDHVDADAILKPVKWDLKLIRRFMLVFGLLNSAADYLTFGVLYFFLKADPGQFRSGWFIENVISAALVVLVIRTRHSIFKSKPSSLLSIAVIGVCILVFLLPLTPFKTLFELEFLPLNFYFFLAAIIVIYIVSVEIAKRFFFRKL